jgi:hypothetical protein
MIYICREHDDKVEPAFGQECTVCTLVAAQTRLRDAESKLGKLSKDYEQQCEINDSLSKAVLTQADRLDSALATIAEAARIGSADHHDLSPEVLCRMLHVLDGTCCFHEVVVERQSLNCSACGKPLDLEHTWCHACASSAYQSE